MLVDAGTPHVGGGGLEFQALLPGDVPEDAQGLGHDLRAYVISGEYGELEGRH
jgi:hypothetical protein